VSLAIAIKAPEGIVLAAESRVTVTVTQPSGLMIPVNFDNATKLLSFNAPFEHVGAVTYGQAMIGLRTAASFIPEFEASQQSEDGDGIIPTEDFASRLSRFYVEQWGQWQDAQASPYAGSDMVFLVGGYDRGAPYGRLFEFGIPSNPSPREHHAGVDGFGVAWGGQREFVDRLLKGYDRRLPSIIQEALNLDQDALEAVEQALQPLAMPLPLQVLALQDCIDLAIFFIRTTIGAQQLTITLRGVGGFIDVATITRVEGLRYIQRKALRGETGSGYSHVPGGGV
jgi:hypothetical protein